MANPPEIVGDLRDGVFYASGAKAPVVLVTALDGVTLPQPIRTKILLPGPKGSLYEMALSKGQQVPPHRFAHDFIGFLVRGSVQVTLAKKQYPAEPRDGWAAAAGCESSMTALEDSTVLEWMSPPHMVSGTQLISWGATLPCDSHLFGKWKDTTEFRLQRVEGTTEFGPAGVDVNLVLRTLIPGPHGALTWTSHRKGKVANHIHQHTFCCYLIKGRVREKFGARQEHICEPGDIWAAQAGAQHYTEALEDPELLEFKWPAPMQAHGLVQSWEPPHLWPDRKV